MIVIPKWVDTCVRRYRSKGMKKEEAWKRCMGAYKKTKRRSRKKRNV